jgi:hypothetical protein
VSMRRGEIIVALFLVAVCVAAWISSAGFVAETAMVRTLSPAFYPRVLVAGLTFCAILMLVRAYRTRTSEITVAWGQWYNVLVASGVMFLQVFTFEELGCFPSAWIALFLLMRITHVPLGKSVLISSAFLVFVYLFFVLLLKLQFPMEFLPTLLRGE